MESLVLFVSKFKARAVPVGPCTGALVHSCWWPPRALRLLSDSLGFSRASEADVFRPCPRCAHAHVEAAGPAGHQAH
jgi:hypothetical protein